MSNYDPKSITIEGPDPPPNLEGRYSIYRIHESQEGELTGGRDYRIVGRWHPACLRLILETTGNPTAIETEMLDSYPWPDLFIERQKDLQLTTGNDEVESLGPGWRLTLAPNSGDPCAIIHIAQDGRIVLEDPEENREDITLQEPFYI